VIISALLFRRQHGGDHRLVRSMSAWRHAIPAGTNVDGVDADGRTVVAGAAASFCHLVVMMVAMMLSSLVPCCALPQP